METSDIARIIRDRAIANGVDPSVLARIAQIESSNDPNAGSGSSSAKGLFQFTDATAKRYNLANPYDPAASSDAAARLLKDNAAGLGTSDPGSLYLAHFAGLGGAQKLLAADPSASAESVLGPAAVKANPFLARMTVADVRNWASGKMGQGGPAAPSGQPSATQAPSEVASAQGQPQVAPADQADPTDAAMAAFRQIMAQQADALPAPQFNLLRAAVNPRRTVTLNG